MLFDEVFQGARMDSHDHGGLFACGFIDGILGCGFERRVELFPRDIASEGAISSRIGRRRSRRICAARDVRSCVLFSKAEKSGICNTP